MTDKIKYFAKLSSIALSNFLKISVFGILSVALSVTIGLILMPFKATHGGLLLLALVPILLIIISTWLIISFAGSFAMKKIINMIVQDKSESTLYPLLDKVLAKLKTNENTRVIKKGMNASLIKLQLIESANNLSENKWIRKAFIYSFKKIKINDINFNEDNSNMNDIIKLKTIQGLKDVSKPSMRNFWLIIGFHWLMVLIIILMR